MPAGIGVALVAINPAYRTYDASGAGQVVLSIIVVAQGAGYVWLCGLRVGEAFPEAHQRST